MARPANLTLALNRTWERIAADVHARLRKQFLTAAEVKQAIREELDALPAVGNARKYWMPLSDAEKQEALDHAISPGSYWMADEEGEPIPKPEGWE